MEDLIYPDDLTPSSKDNAEVLLTGAIEEGKSHIRLSNLNKIGESLRDKLSKFLGKVTHIDNNLKGDDNDSRYF